MKAKANLNLQRERSLPKCPTGIAGFDEITLGGLPRGRPSLICGGAGCGKTLFGMEFLARGARILTNLAYASPSRKPRKTWRRTPSPWASI